MTLEEQIKLAIECDATEHKTESGNDHSRINHFFEFTIQELAAYTAAVEAKERERCAVVCENAHDSRNGDCAKLIMELK